MTLPIASVETSTIALPLPQPLRLGAMTVVRREYTAVRVSDGEGRSGIAYALSREAPMGEIVERLLAPHLVGRAFASVAEAWDAAFRGSAIVGRVGLVRRALGLLDDALWDLEGRRRGAPVWRLLGTGAEPREAMIVASYPSAGRSVADVVSEVAAYADWPLVKVSRSPDPAFMGGLLRALRDALPATTGIVVDVGFGWEDADAALAEIRAWGDVELAWLEDPLLPEDVEGVARLSAAGGHRIGVGDEVTDPDVLRSLVERGGVGVLRVDPVAIGGVTAAMDVVSWAGERGVPVSCHVSPEVSVHLGAGVETFDRSREGNPYDPSPLLVEGGPEYRDGRAVPPVGPGFGFGFARGTFGFEEDR